MENRQTLNHRPAITLSSAIERERTYMLNKITVMLEQKLISAEKFARMKAELYGI